MSRTQSGLAVFLTAIMVLSMVGIGFTGGAVAQAPTDDTDLSESLEDLTLDEQSLDEQSELDSELTSSAEEDETLVEDEVRDKEGKTTLLLGVERGVDSAQADAGDLQADSEETLQPVVDELESLEATEVRNTFWVGNIVSVTVDLDTVDVDRLAAIPGVNTVTPNVEADHPMPPQSDDTAEVDELDSEFTFGLEQMDLPGFEEEFNATGENTTVSIIDDGFSDPEEGHPDVEIATEAIAAGGEVTEGELGEPGAHGEHVAGTATGAADPVGDVPRFGVAPGADLLKINAFEGDAELEDVIASVEYSVEQDVDVASMSLGFPFEQFSVVDLEMENLMQEANAAGTVVIGSTGNEGAGDAGGPATSPGAEFSGLSVGASNAVGDIAGFSSGAVISENAIEFIQEDGEYPEHYPREFVKPDVSAAGEDVLSAGPLQEDIGDEAATYSFASGTSMAAPHVAGAVALIQSATDEDLSAQTIENALAETAEKPADADFDSVGERDIRYGTGLINVTAATMAAEEVTTIEGEVTDEDGEPIVGASVESDEGALTSTDEDGEYTLEVTDSDEVTVDAFGFTAQTESIDEAGDFQLDSELAVDLLEDQPAFAEFGGEFSAVVDVKNLDEFSAVLSEDTTVNEDDLTLLLNGDEVEFGETVELDGFDGMAEVTVDIDEDADVDEGDLVGLDHTFTGLGDDLEVPTGPTELTEELDPAFYEIDNLDAPEGWIVDEPIPVSFEITNTGQEAADDRGYEFFATDGDTVINLPPTVTPIEPGETEEIELTVDGVDDFFDAGMVIEHGVETGVIEDGLLGPVLAEVDDTLSADLALQSEGSDFQVADLQAPTEVDSGEEFTVSATIQNVGEDADEQDVAFALEDEVLDELSVELDGFELDETDTTADVEFTVVAPDESGFYTHGVFTDDDAATATLAVDETLTTATVVGSEDEFGPQTVDLLERGLDDGQPVDIQYADAGELDDGVMASTDVFVFHDLGDAAEDVIPAVEDDVDTTAVYLEQFSGANAIADRSGITGDPDESIADFDVGSNFPVDFFVEEDHPLFDGVADAGESFTTHTTADADRAFFEGADGDTLAEVGVEGNADGPVATVDPETGSVLLGTIAPNSFQEEPDFTDEAAQVLANAVDVAADEVVTADEVGQTSIDADFVGTVDDAEEITVEASDVAASDGEEVTFTVGDKPVATAEVEDESASAEFNPQILDDDVAGDTFEIGVEELDVIETDDVDVVHETVDLQDGFNLLSVPMAADLTAENVTDINVWNSEEQSYETVTNDAFDSAEDLHNALYVSAGDDDARLGMTFGDDVPAGGTATVDEGWNLLGSNFPIDSPEDGDERSLSEDLLEVDEEDLTIFASDFNDQLEGDDSIEAFDAYWAFVSDDPEERAIISPSYDVEDRLGVLGVEGSNFTVDNVETETLGVDELDTEYDDILGSDEVLVEVTADIENEGDLTDTQFIDLVVDGDFADRDVLELADGDEDYVTLEYATSADDVDGIDVEVVTEDSVDDDDQDLGTGELVVSDQAQTLEDETVVDSLDFGDHGALQVVDPIGQPISDQVAVEPGVEENIAIPSDSVFGTVTVELLDDDENVVTDEEINIQDETIEISEFNAPPSAFENETVTVDADVTNNALLEEADVPVEFEVEGEAVETKTIDIEAGATENVEFDVDTEEFGLELGDSIEHGVSTPSDAADAELTIANAAVDFADQAVSDDSNVTLENVTADEDQYLVITDTSEELNEVGSEQFDERVNGETVSVDLEEAAEPGEHIAFVTEDGDISDEPEPGDEALVTDDALVVDADVEIEDDVFEQSTEELTVQNSFVAPDDEEYFVAIHDADDPEFPIIGDSGPLMGNNLNVNVELEEELNATTEVVAMLHFAEDGNLSDPIPVGEELNPVTDDAEAQIDFEVTDLEAPDVAFTGEEITVDATVENPGTAADTQFVDFFFDGDFIATSEVTIDANDSATVTFEAAVDDLADETGEFEHGVTTTFSEVTADITVEEPEAALDFKDQVITTADDEYALVVDDVVAEAGQFVTITQDDADLTEVGQVQVDDRVGGDEVVVPINDSLVDQDEGDELVAHVSTDPSAIQPAEAAPSATADTDDVLVNDDATIAYDLSFGDQILDDGTVAVDDVIGAEGDTLEITANDSVVGDVTLDEDIRGGDAVFVEIEDASEFPGEHTAELETADDDTAGVFNAEIDIPEQAFEGDSTDQIGLTTADLLDGADNETAFDVTIEGVSNEFTGTNTDVTVEADFDETILDEPQDVTAELELSGYDLSEAGQTSLSDTEAVYDANLQFNNVELIDGADDLDEVTVQTADLFDELDEDEGLIGQTEFTVEIHETEEGGVGDIIGSATGLVDANSYVPVELDRDVEDGEELVAMLHFGEDGETGDPIPSSDVFPDPVTDESTVDVSEETLTFNDQALDTYGEDSEFLVEEVYTEGDRTIVITDEELDILGQTDVDRSSDEDVFVDLGDDVEAGDYIAHIVDDTDDVGDDGGIVTDDATVFDFDSEVVLDDASDSVAEDEAPAVVDEVNVSTAVLTDGFDDETNFTVTIKDEDGMEIGETDELNGENDDVMVDIDDITLDEPGTLTEELTATLDAVEDVPATGALPAEDNATVELSVGEEEASVALPDQALGSADDSDAVLAEDVTGEAGQFVVITSDDSELEEVGVAELDERTVNEDVVVEVDEDLEAGEYRAHLTSDVGLIDDDALVTDAGTIFDAELTVEDQVYEDSTEEVIVSTSDLQPETEYDLFVSADGEELGTNGGLEGAQTDVSVTVDELDTTTTVNVTTETEDTIQAVSDGSFAPITDSAEIEIQQAEEGDLTFADQALSADNEVLVENVEPVEVVTVEQDAFDPADDFLVLTEGDEVEDGEDVIDFVRVGDVEDGTAALNATDADATDHTAVLHEPMEVDGELLPDPDAPRTDASTGEVVNDTAAVYSVETLELADQEFVGETDEVSVTAAIDYEGDGLEEFHIDLHPSDEEGNIVGDAFVGVSTEDVAIDGEEQDLTVEIVEEREAGDNESDREDAVIDETDTFFAMPHLGEAGDVDGDRVPGLEPALVSFVGDDGLVPVVDAGEVTILNGDSVEVEAQPDEEQTASVPLTAEDADGPAAVVTDGETPVEGVDVSVAAINASGDITAGETTVETNESGVAVFDDLEIEVADDNYQLEFEIDAEDFGIGANDTATTDAFDVDVGDADAVFADDVTVTANDTADSQSFTATVEDEFGNTIEGETVEVDEDGLEGLAGGDTATTDADGVATFEFNEGTADDYDVDLELIDDEDTVNSTSLNVTVEPAAADSIEVVALDPDEIDAGEEFNVSFSATDEFDNDAVNQTLTNVNVTAEEDGEVFEAEEIELDENAEATVTVPEGEVTTAGDQDITVDADDVSSDSAELTVDAGDLAQLVVDDVDPDPVTAGDGVDVTVETQDEFGNVVEDETLDLTIISESQGEVFSDGEASFNGQFEASTDDLTTADDAHTLDVETTEEGVSNTSVDVMVDAAPADTLEADDISVAFDADDQQFTAETIDEFNNAVEDVDIEIDESDPTLRGLPFSVSTDSDGIATFNFDDDRPNEYTVDLVAPDQDETDGELVEEGLTVTVTGNAEDVQFEPSDIGTQTAGEEFTATAEALDENDNAVPDVTVDIEVEEDPGELSGTTSVVSDEEGAAEFDDLVIEEAADDYELTVSIDDADGNVDERASYTTDAFDVEPADADSVVVETEPDSDQTAGEELTAEDADGPEASVTDEFGNDVDGVDVSVEAIDGDGDITEGDTTVSTDGDGIATFDDLEIEDADDYRLEFSIDEDDEDVAASDDAQSQEFTVEAADPETLTSEDVTIAADDDDRAFTAEVEDDFGNPVPDVDVEIDEADGISPDSFSNTTNDQGISTHTFNADEPRDYDVELEVDGTDITAEPTVNLITTEATDIDFDASPEDEEATTEDDDVTYTVTVTGDDDTAVKNLDVDAELLEEASVDDNDGIEGVDATERTDEDGEVTFTAESDTAQIDAEVEFEGIVLGDQLSDDGLSADTDELAFTVNHVLDQAGDSEEAFAAGQELDLEDDEVDIESNDLTGSGSDDTTLVGNVTVEDDENTITGLTITGDLTVDGDDNTFDDVSVEGDFNDNGERNEFMTSPESIGGSATLAGSDGSFDNVAVDEDITVEGDGYELSETETDGLNVQENGEVTPSDTSAGELTVEEGGTLTLAENTVQLEQDDGATSWVGDISTAVDDADADANLTVAEGTYDESVTVDTEGLTLEGPNAGIHADSEDRGDEATITDGVFVDDNPSGVVIDGFEVERTIGEAEGVIQIGSTSDPGANDLTIKNNVITATAEDEQNLGTILIEQIDGEIQIEDNLLTQTGDGSEDATVRGLVEAEQLETTEIVVDGNTVETDVGVATSGFSGPSPEYTITDNEFVENDIGVLVIESYDTSELQEFKENNFNGTEDTTYVDDRGDQLDLEEVLDDQGTFDPDAMVDDENDQIVPENGD